MRRGIGGVIVAGLVVMSLGAQDRTLEPRAFAEVVRFETSLRELETAVNDPDLTAALIGRVLVFDGVVSSVSVWAADTPRDFYAEIELVSATWTDSATLESHRALVIATGVGLASRVLASTPHEPEHGQVYRMQRVLIAGTLQGFATLGASEMPVIEAYEIRMLS